MQNKHPHFTTGVKNRPPIALNSAGWFLLLVGGLALGLRLWFILGVSQVQIVWDTGIYWDATQQVRNALCNGFIGCLPDARPTLSSAQIWGLAYSREGLLPLVMGLLLAFFPNVPATAYVFHALLDALACVMVALLCLRLTGRVWVGLCAGLLLALYVPAITNAGTLLQQPMLRFGLSLVLWAYGMCFITAPGAAAKPRRGLLYAGLGTVGALLVGFGSITTRPLLWLILISVLGLMLVYRQRLGWRLFVAQALYSAGALLLLLALLLTSAPPDRPDALARILTGLSAQGTDENQTTILSFPHFWPPSSWQTVIENPTQSLFGDAARDPLAFAYWWNYSLYSNYRYPDYAYLQVFGLDLPQQRTQHTLLLLLALVGVAYALGQPGAYRPVLLLSAVIVAYLSAIYSIISPEPRRMSALAPVWALAAAWGMWALWQLWRHQRRWRGWQALLLPLMLAAWLLPFPVVHYALPLSPGYTLLVLARLLLTGAAVYVLVAAWARMQPGFLMRWPLVFCALMIAPVGLAQFQDHDWRGWATRLEVDEVGAGAARQQIGGITRYEHLHPWLIIDLGTAEQAQEVSITVNEQVLKPAGAPMYTWEAGIPAEWSPYGTLKAMANFNAPRRMWQALPLPPDLLEADTLTIDLQAITPGLWLYGDYTDGENYTGPLFSPWYTGQSFWRWQWNGEDPRIPAAQPLNGRYESQRLKPDGGVITGDLSSYFGRHTGLYRVYVVQAAFGQVTNAFGAPGRADAETLCDSSDERLLMAPGTTAFYICQRDDGDIRYYDAGALLGQSAWAVFEETQPENTLIDQIQHPDGGIDLIQVMKNLYVANFYDNEGHLAYSMLFNAA